MAILGNQPANPSGWTLDGNSYINVGGPFLASENGDITSISVYVGYAGNATFAVWEDDAGSPDTRVACTTESSCTVGWNQLSASGTISAGKSYWIGYQGSGTASGVYNAGTGTWKYTSATYVAGNLPNPIGTSNLVGSYDKASYLTYTPNTTLFEGSISHNEPSAESTTCTSTVAASGGTAPLTYSWAIKANSTPSFPSDVVTGATTSGYTFTDLTPETQYYVIRRVTDANNNTADANDDFITADGLEAGYLRMIWYGDTESHFITENACCGTPPYTYQLQNSIDGNNWTNIGSPSSYNLLDATALNENTSYYFRVLSTDAGTGSVTSNSVLITTKSTAEIGMPTPPVLFGTRYISPTGTTRYVHLSGDNVSPHYSGSDALQGAINDAALGDVIIVDVDYVWDNTTEGTSLRLRSKTGTGWIYIISAELELMPEGIRITDADAIHMPKIKSNPKDINGIPALSAISTDAPSAAHHYRFCGIEFVDPRSTNRGTDLLVDASNNKKVTSASYSFTSNDVGLYIGIPSTVGNWTGGAYLISSVSSGAAILSTSPASTNSSNGVWELGLYNQYNIINLNSTITLANGGETGSFSLKQDGVYGNDRMPSYIWFDRCYIHSERNWPFLCPVGIQFDGEYIAIFDSRIENIRGVELGDCLNFYEGNGPYHIKNNYLESTTSNIMIGATDPTYGYLNGNLPSDIEITNNHFVKNPTLWGTHYLIYNHIEIKNGQRIKIHGNYFEQCYRSDNGHGAPVIELSVRNATYTAPWSANKDIDIRNNFARSAGKFCTVNSCDLNARIYGSSLIADNSHSTNQRVSASDYTFVAGDINRVIEIDGDNSWKHTYAKISNINSSPNYAVLDQVVAANGSTNGVFRSCQQTTRIKVHNNCADDLSATYTAGYPQFLIILSSVNGVDVKYLTFDHNLFVANGEVNGCVYLSPNQDGEDSTNLVIANNIMAFGDYGLFRNGGLYAKAALDAGSTAYTWNKNAYYTRSSTDLNYAIFIDPSGNTGTFYSTTPWASRPEGGNIGTCIFGDTTWSNWGPEEIAGVGFSNFNNESQNLEDRNYVLSLDSPYSNAGTDGKDLGPDWTILNAAILHAVNGDLALVKGSLSARSYSNYINLYTTESTNGTPTRYYQLQIKTHGGNNWVDVGSLQESLQWTINNLLAMTTYDFRVIYTDADNGYAISDTLSQTTTTQAKFCQNIDTCFRPVIVRGAIIPAITCCLNSNAIAKYTEQNQFITNQSCCNDC